MRKNRPPAADTTHTYLTLTKSQLFRHIFFYSEPYFFYKFRVAKVIACLIPDLLVVLLLLELNSDEHLFPKVQQPQQPNHDDDYFALGINTLTSQEESYVQLRARNVNPSAAARSAGYRKPALAVADLAERADVQRAIAYFREMSRQASIDAGAIEFTRNDATAMLMESHAKSATATEEVNAIDKLIKLHGLNTPDTLEINVTRKDQLEELSDEDLMKLSKQDILLSPEEYSTTTE